MTTANKKATLTVVGDNTLPEGHVPVRILKPGHEMISTGEVDFNSRPVKFKWKETTSMPKHIAEAYQDRGFVEIDE